jgi:SNF2 family DNA or RNA helicase
MRFAMIVARDDITGQPMYRNLDRLNALVAKHSYRVLKTECLDLPPKVYTSTYFELSPEQQKAYELMEQLMRIELEDGTVTPVAALASLVKLQQITSGFVVVPGREDLMYIGEKNPRVEAIADYIEENDCGSTVVWCKFREEIRAVSERLTKLGRKVVEYHGGVSERDRESAIDRFQSFTADTFIGMQKAGATGIPLFAATTVIYGSNEYSALLRNQSEDRSHRKGTTGTVTYVDVVATGTIDESITKAHQWKTDLAATILGDRKLDLRRFL